MFRKIENHPHKGYLSQTPVYKRVFSCQQDRNTLRSTLQTQIPNFYQFTRLQSNQEPTYPATLSPKNHGFSGKLRPGHGKWRGAPCLPKVAPKLKDISLRETFPHKSAQKLRVGTFETKPILSFLGSPTWKINMEAENDGLVQMIFRISIGWFWGSSRSSSGV